ncbi:hypothetical protein HSTV1_49 [Haloarcula sinaiiensis tailed virus 1]|uniref:Uncharacterized protein n=1 Tax=Haloarcula sinaiiensis tailed virus 1 TaxID=1262530 RepID=R9QT44_9CAUD|nr:hypothetical protein HSTV1_49 [Haloarcula sinaiiensis tailed virus 1]AGC34598.1 hypothetical protein HSTV1_49 [Haloarcula sinaiiensis tailed virus 1]
MTPLQLAVFGYAVVLLGALWYGLFRAWP